MRQKLDTYMYVRYSLTYSLVGSVKFVFRLSDVGYDIGEYRLSKCVVRSELRGAESHAFCNVNPEGAITCHGRPHRGANWVS